MKHQKHPVEPNLNDWLVLLAARLVTTSIHVTSMTMTMNPAKTAVMTMMVRVKEL